LLPVGRDAPGPHHFRITTDVAGIGQHQSAMRRVAAQPVVFLVSHGVRLDCALTGSQGLQCAIGATCAIGQSD
jgi:hypothetical protein